MNGHIQNLKTYGRQIVSGFGQLKHLRLSSLRKVFSLMGKRERIAVAVLSAVALSSLGWSGSNIYYTHTVAAPAPGGFYAEGMLGQPTYINPLLAYQETDLALTKIVFSGLYKYDSQGRLVADLAEGQPEISEDQKQYTINLKRNVKWHNDKPFSADDVVFTIQSLKDPAYKSPLRSAWLTTGVEKISDYQVKFTTKDVSGPFLHNLTLPILPKSVWGKVVPQNFLISDLNIKAVGTGPFSIKEIKKMPSGKIQQISLNSFTNYYGGRPKLDQITVKFYDSEEDLLNAFHSREVSGFGYVPMGSSLYVDKDQNESQVFSAPLPQYQVLFFNLNNKILAEQEVRTALSLATDKSAVIDGVFKNNALVPASPFLPDLKPGTTAPAPDIAKAKEMLDKAGWKVDAKTGVRAKKNIPFELTIITNDFLLNSKAAEMVANQWRALEVKVHLAVMPTKQLTDSVIRPRSFDVLLFPLKSGADPDPFAFWHSSQSKDPGFNLTGFSSQDGDRLITEARTTTNEQLKQQKYQELDRLIAEKIPAIFLDQTMYVYAVDKEIKNVTLHTLYEPNQRFYDLPNWYMKEQRVWK